MERKREKEREREFFFHFPSTYTKVMEKGKMLDFQRLYCCGSEGKREDA